MAPDPWRPLPAPLPTATRPQMGFCSIRQQYSPELVRQRAIGSLPSFLALAARGSQIGWEVGLFLAGLWWDSLQGAAEDSVRVKYRATQLRDLLTRLGPTFIKAGQVCAGVGVGAAGAGQPGRQRGLRPPSAAVDGCAHGVCPAQQHRACPPAHLSTPRARLHSVPTRCTQVLANRPDIVREDYMNELCVLQDDVPSFPDEEARTRLAISDWVWAWVWARVGVCVAPARPPCWPAGWLAVEAGRPPQLPSAACPALHALSLALPPVDPRCLHPPAPPCRRSPSSKPAWAGRWARCSAPSASTPSPQPPWAKCTRWVGGLSLGAAARRLQTPRQRRP